MKTNLAYRELESGNLGDTSGFAIKAGGKAFRVIIDGMYSNKPQSITREIWSNAYDEHRMSGVLTKPFKVSFPTSFDSSFRCRDYGPGMDHDFMMNRYTVAFDSTKEDTNDAVGFLGIGRLSPFSYTDTYSVTVWQGGEARYYSVYLNQDGTPNISLMSTEPSDEPDGTEVSFAVESGDRNEFRKAAMFVSLGFDVKPVCTQSDFEGWPEINTQIKGDGWVIYSSGADYDHPLYYGGSYAKMGCVLYPLGNTEFEYGTPEYQLLSNSKVIIDFDIGDLAVTASRENLSFGRHEPTKESVIKAVSKMCSELEQSTLDTIAAAPNLWKAKLIMAKLGYLPREVAKGIQAKAEWGGNKIEHGTTFEVPFSICNLSNYEFRRRKVVQWSGRYTIFVDNNPKVVIEETEAGKRDVRGPSRISKWWGTVDIKHREAGVLWIKVNDSNRKEVHDWLKENADHLEVVYAKDMADPGVNRSSSGGTRSKTMVKEYQSGSNYTNVELTEDEWEDGGVYLRIKNNECVDGQYHYSKVYNAMCNAGMIPDMRLIVVPKTYWTKFQNADQWVDLYDMAQEYLDDKGIDKLKRVSHRYYRADNSVYALPKVESPSIKLFNEFLRSGNARDEDTGINPPNAKALLEAFNLYTHNYSLVQRVRSVVKKLKKRAVDKYPLLTYYSGSNEEEFVNYINLMDKE